jgi:cytochrome c553
MKLRLWHLGLALLAAPPLAVFVAWLGVFNVGAASGHWAVTEWFLHFAMRSSVRTYALGEDAPEPLPREALRPAAGHYARGCAICHGAPGEPRSAAVRQMLPPPPDLAPVLDDWTDAELFRIVKYGVRYTGMPAWPAQARDDEVWAMVAFLRALPRLSPEAYAELVTAPAGTLPAACAGCHGPDGRGGGPHVPTLAGQSAAYLEASLAAYADGRRASGFMQQAARDVPATAWAEIARELAALPPPATVAAAPPLLAEHGRPDDLVPACLACHGEPRRNPLIPRLAGLPAPYVAAQLRLFRAGERGGGPFAHVMARVARNLTDADIETLAAWIGGEALPSADAGTNPAP